jgi:hypothetical protein
VEAVKKERHFWPAPARETVEAKRVETADHSTTVG